MFLAGRPALKKTRITNPQAAESLRLVCCIRHLHRDAAHPPHAGDIGSGAESPRGGLEAGLELPELTTLRDCLVCDLQTDDSISHQIETMIETIVWWYLQWESSFQGFLGAGFRPSNACKCLLTLSWVRVSCLILVW